MSIAYTVLRMREFLLSNFGQVLELLGVFGDFLNISEYMPEWTFKILELLGVFGGFLNFSEYMPEWTFKIRQCPLPFTQFPIHYTLVTISTEAVDSEY
jgi:hypothetical protein